MELRFLISCVFVLLSTIVKSQTPCFTVENTIGCTPFTVKVKNCCTNYSQRFYTYENTQKSSDSVYTFTKPGVYTITQFVVKDSTHRNDPTPGLYFKLVKENLITVVDAIPPKFKLLSCPDNRLRVEINDSTTQKYTHYYINYGDGGVDTILKFGFKEHPFLDSLPKTINIRGAIMPLNCGDDTTFVYNNLFSNNQEPQIDYLKTSTISANNGEIEIVFSALKFLTYQVLLNGKEFIRLNNLSGKQVYKFNGLNTIDSTYSIQIKSLNVCNSTSLDSDIYGVAPFKVEVQENLNRVFEYSYFDKSKVDSYELYRNGVLVQKYIQSDFPLLNDTDVKCGSKYCYVIKTMLKSGVYLVTDTVCVTAISTSLPSVLTGVNSSIVSGKVNVFAEIAANSSFLKINIFKKNTIGGFNLFKETRTFPFIDFETYNSTTCYKTSITDSCENTSELSEETCPLLLLASNVTSNSIQLDWKNYIGWDTNPLKKYTLQWVNDQDIPYKFLDLSTTNQFVENTEDTISSKIRYRIMAEDFTSNFLTYSNVVERKQAVKVFLPTSFTPNNDGENDVYFAKGRFVSEFKMYIYNRLGQLVFYSDNMKQGWDGYNSMSGDYVVEVEANDTIGNKISKKTILSLIK